MSLVLVTGGTRSGKSGVAEYLASGAGAPVVYVGTATAADEEMDERIARHRAGRPSGWRTVETLDPSAAFAQADGATLLVDGIGGWIAELMRCEGLWTDSDVAPLTPTGEHARTRVLERVGFFADAAARRRGSTVVVAEECGSGLVSAGAGVRRFVDLIGEATQLLAAHAERVQLVVAGCAVEVKGCAVQPVPPELRVHGDSMAPPGALDFAVSVVAAQPPEWLRTALASALEGASSYPDERDTLRALADRHGREEAEVLPLNGSAEGFWLVASALRPSRAVVVHPSFTEPEVALRAMGRRVERVFREPDGFSLEPSAVPADADLVFVGSPNNPTGTLDAASSLEQLARPDRVLVVDEAFMELVAGEAESLAHRKDVPGLVVLRSLTKVWSVPGIRAGYAVGPPELVGAMRAVRQPWSVNTLALVALAACARNADAVRAIAEETAVAREELTKRLRELSGVEVWPSAANFLLLRLPGGDRVRAALLEREIAVRQAETFPGLTPDHLRVAVRRPEDNRLLVEALAGVLQ